MFNDLGQLSRGELERLAQTISFLVTPSFGTDFLLPGGAGATVQPILPQPPFWATITGKSGNAYAFHELVEEGGPIAWANAGLRSDGNLLTPAYEVRDNLSVPVDGSAIVRMWLADSADHYLFEYASGGNTNQTVAPNTTITVSPGVPASGSTPAQPPGAIVFAPSLISPGLFVMPVETGPTAVFPASPQAGQTFLFGGSIYIYLQGSWQTWDPLPAPVLQTSVLVTDAHANIGWTPTGIAGEFLLVNAGLLGVWTAMSGDATLAPTGAVTVTKTGGVAFAPSATIDTTNASNISSGTLPTGRFPGGAFNGASELVQLDSGGKLPAVDASALLNVPAPSVSTQTLGAVLTLSGVPQWYRFSIAFGDIAAIGNVASGTITLATLPAGTMVHAVAARHQAVFTGVTNTLTGTVGVTAANYTDYVGSAILLSAPPAVPLCNNGSVSAYPNPLSSQATTLLKARLSSTGTNLSTCSGGGPWIIEALLSGPTF